MINCNTDWKKKTTHYAIKGIQSNSSSPTDTWFVTYFDKDENPVCKSFIKIWVSNHHIPEIDALEYEAKVYKQIKKDFDSKKEPYFVELIDFVENVSYDNMVNFLKKGLPALDDKNIENNFERNVYYMLTESPGRPAIDVFKKGTFKKISRSATFSYIQTMVYDTTFSKFLQSKKNNVDSKFKVFNKVLEGIVELNKKNIYHQDLHFGNIFVTADGNVRIYDYDRSYSEKIGNNKLIEGYYCENFGSCNEKNDIIDLLKVFCNLQSTTDLITLDDLIQILFKDPPNKDIENIKMQFETDLNLHKCFFSKAQANGSIFKLRSGSEMIETFHKLQHRKKVDKCVEYIKKKHLEKKSTRV
jgi:hypothetical protein